MKNFYYCNRVVYGVYKAYPVNSVANQFARLLNVKTFSKVQLDQIAALGFGVHVVADPQSPAYKAEVADQRDANPAAFVDEDLDNFDGYW